MLKAGRVALAKFVMRGKESIVLIRPAQKGLMLHTMYFADEVRDFGEVDKGEDAKVKPGELELAERLVGELSSEAFKPETYADEYRGRVLAAVETKVEGKEVTSLAPQAQRTQVIDLMDALKQSLGKRGSDTRANVAAAGGTPAKVAKLEKKPAARAREKAEPAPREKKAGGGRR
jgi:DNA end-binding protein Ku